MKVFILLLAGLIFLMGASSDAFAKQTKPSLESYSDLAHQVKCNNFRTSEQGTVYMWGQGFVPEKEYKVYFWNKVGSVWYSRQSEEVSTDAAGELSNQHIFLQGVDQPGQWRAVVYDSVSYSPVAYQPNDSRMVVAHAFHVSAAAIPEFSGFVSGAAAIGICFAIYWWTRKRRLEYVKA